MSVSATAGQPATGRRIVPAHLDFLAIYNPTLSTSEHDERNQIVFFHSRQPLGDERNNEELRQIGLAQGIVNLARGFSRNNNPDCVDTEKHRIVLTEVEPNWWTLASVNLTCIPVSSPSGTDQDAYEYSAREVSPAALLLQQLASAWRIFLLHQGVSIQAIFQNAGRSKFCVLLDIYWSAFARDWDVLLHGNPAADIYNGIKLAAGGELGVGVGEEEWGSGERDVLEDLVNNTQGAMDLVVARFGDAATDTDDTDDQQKETGAWLGQLQQPGPSDGVVFSGIGTLTAEGLRTLSEWSRRIYILGDDAYGIRNNPGAARHPRRRRTKASPPPLPKGQSTTDDDLTPTGPGNAPREEPNVPFPSVPPPIVGAVDETAQSRSADANQGIDSLLAFPDAKTWKSVLSLGYGSVWSIPGLQKEPNEATEPKEDAAAGETNDDLPKKRKKSTGGAFIIGLKGNLEELDLDDEADIQDDLNRRLVMRTIHVEVNSDELDEDEADDARSSSASERGPAMSAMTPITQPKIQKVRVVVYVQQPFVYTFLFEMGTTSLSMPNFFRRLHSQITPLHKQLLASTSPSNVANRLKSVLPQGSSSIEAGGSPIYELLYNPHSLTVHTSIPNIPMPFTSHNVPATAAAMAPSSSWTRAEALNVHMQILGNFADTRRLGDDKEHTTKTSRGWWVVWMRLVSTGGDPLTSGPGRPQQGFREAVLVRRASDYTAPKRHGSSSQRSSAMGLGRFLGRESASASPSSSRLTEGVGVDPRKYVESLLSLNR